MAKITYTWDGSYIGDAKLILERVDDQPKYYWRGYYDGGSIMRLYRAYPWGYGDKIYDKKPRKVSIFEVKRV